MQVVFDGKHVELAPLSPEVYNLYRQGKVFPMDHLSS